MATVLEERLARLETEVENLATTFALHEKRQDGEFQSITAALVEIQKQLGTRLPTWATLMMTGMGSMLGVLVGVVATHRIS